MHTALALMFRLLCLPLLLFLSPVAIAAAGKHALVIGNDAYQNVDKLQKAVSDARGYRDVLSKLGYRVTLVENQTLDQMQRQLANFQETLQAGDAAVFVYSGHGWSDGSVNYLLGIDAPRDGAQAYLKKKSIPLQNGQDGVLDDIRSTGVALQVAIIDACRDNPFHFSGTTKSIGMARGLARIDPPSGIFLVQSAGAGQTALDRLSNGDSERYSVFTRVFLPLLASGRPLNEVIKQAQSQVTRLAATIDHKQTPMYADQVTGDVCLREVCTAAEPQVPSAKPEQLAFDAAQASNSLAGWQAYLKRYPNGSYAGVAEVQLAALSRPNPSPLPAPAPAQPSESQPRDCADCPEMVRIPGGTFRMGDLGDKGDSNEKLVHEVSIRPFSVGKFEVTFAEWDVCAAAGDCRTKRNDQGWGRGNRPVINVSWDDAQQYVKWLNGKTGKRYRLLTESEWEYVARAGTTTEYSFGNCIDTGKANYNGNYEFNGCGKTGKYLASTAAVGSYPANAWGLHDVHGNVWEWTEDCWHGSYAGAPTDGSAWTSGGDCARRVVRGGSWGHNPRDVRSAIRGWLSASGANGTQGIRLASTD